MTNTRRRASAENRGDLPEERPEFKPAYLPEINWNKGGPAPAQDRGWSKYDAGQTALGKLATALVVPITDTRPEQMKSVPSPWGRLLLFEHALLRTGDPGHPARTEVLDEWRGLLGLVALADVLGVRVSASATSLSERSGAWGEIAQTLLHFTPGGNESEDVRWTRFAVIKAADRPVGALSPRTLVFTGIGSSIPASIPFTRRVGEGTSALRLRDPVAYYEEHRNGMPIRVLREWIRSRKAEGRGPIEEFLGHDAGGIVLELLEDWEKAAGKALGSLDQNPQVFGAIGYGTSAIAGVLPEDHPGRPAAELLRPVNPIGEPEQNDLKIEASDRVVNPVHGVILRDEQPFSGIIQLPRGRTRAAHDGRIDNYQGDDTDFDASVYFESTLLEVVDVRPEAATLVVEGRHYLLPFREGILDHLGVDELTAWTRAEGTTEEVVVQLDVRVQRERVVRFEKRYGRATIRTAQQHVTPQLTVWPDFEVDTADEEAWWTAYFYRLFRPGDARRTLDLRPLDAGELPEVRTSPDGSTTWGTTKRPLRAWRAEIEDAGGLLLAHRPRSVNPGRSNWEVSIDFGSTHTRVFRAIRNEAGNQVIEPVELRALGRMLLGEAGEIESSFFSLTQGETPEAVSGVKEAHSLLRFPLGHPPQVPLLTRAQALELLPGILQADHLSDDEALDRVFDRIEENGQTRFRRKYEWQPIDGVMYQQRVLALSPEGLRSNLKWHREGGDDLVSFESYIAQLYFRIAAEAAQQKARVASLAVAYPSVFSRFLRNRHRAVWERLTARYGVPVKSPISESTALASYLARVDGVPIQTNLLAADVGGSTSDVAVWAKGDHRYGDSVRLAGDLLARVVMSDAAVRAEVRAAAGRPGVDIPAVPFSEDGEDRDVLVFNHLLRLAEARATSRTGAALNLAHNLEDRSEGGERLLAHAGYLFATLSFLLGLMAKREGLDADRYYLRFGGRGAGFLRWLSVLEDGGEESVPAAFFRAGMGDFDATVEVDVGWTTQPKEEIGRGLLTPLDAGAMAEERQTFIGETGVVDEEALGWDAALSKEALSILRPPEQLELERLTVLRRFVQAFETDPLTQRIGRALNISPSVMRDNAFRDKLGNRLFGPGSSWQAAKSGEASFDHALLEPFFVVEARALLEHTTNNTKLFAHIQ